MSFAVSFKCDICGTHYTTDNSMDIPPYWLAVQLAIANQDGIIPDKEQNVFSHFCSKKCLTNYSKSKELEERILTIDQQDVDEEENDNDSDIDGLDTHDETDE